MRSLVFAVSSPVKSSSCSALPGGKTIESWAWSWAGIGLPRVNPKSSAPKPKSSGRNPKSTDGARKAHGVNGLTSDSAFQRATGWPLGSGGGWPLASGRNVGRPCATDVGRPSATAPNPLPLRCPSNLGMQKNGDASEASGAQAPPADRGTPGSKGYWSDTGAGRCKAYCSYCCNASGWWSGTSNSGHAGVCRCAHAERHPGPHGSVCSSRHASRHASASLAVAAEKPNVYADKTKVYGAGCLPPGFVFENGQLSVRDCGQYFEEHKALGQALDGWRVGDDTSSQARCATDSCCHKSHKRTDSIDFQDCVDGGVGWCSRNSPPLTDTAPCSPPLTDMSSVADAQHAMRHHSLRWQEEQALAVDTPSAQSGAWEMGGAPHVRRSRAQAVEASTDSIELMFSQIKSKSRIDMSRSHYDDDSVLSHYHQHAVQSPDKQAGDATCE